MSENHAHKLVVQTAKDLAAAVYEECAKNNAWYKLNPDQAHFIQTAHTSLLAQARQALAMSLGPNSTLPEEQKEVVAEALRLDATLQRRGGNRVFH